MKYKFIGNPDWRFPNLKTNKVYDIEFTDHGLSKYIHGVAVQITSPIRCPYSSYESFSKNWVKVAH